MKKLTTFVIIVFFLLIIGVSLSLANLHEDKEHITIQETTICGDKTVAEGLEIEAALQDNTGLFAELSIDLEEKYVKQSEFSYHSQQDDSIDFSKCDVKYNLEIPCKERDGSWSYGKNSSLMNLYYDTLDQMKTSSETIEVNLADYFSYYPFDLYCTIADKTFFLQNFIQIPMLESEQRKITITKARPETGTDWYTIIQAIEGDRFPCNIYSVFTENACYCVFDTHTQKGSVVDTSEMKNGYGIYKFSFQEEILQTKTDPIYILESPQKIFSLNPEITIIDIFINQENNKLVLATKENDGYTLTIIDIENSTKVYSINVPNVMINAKSDVFQVYYKEDFLVVNRGNLYWDIISCASDGACHYEYSIDVSKQKYNFSDVKLDYNGTNLAIASTLTDSNDLFKIDVYDKHKLLYSGKYTSSLQTGSTSFKYDGDSKTYQNKFMPSSVKSIDIHWN